MSFQKEILTALEDIQQKVNHQTELKQDELLLLFLSSLIEEEGK